MVQYALADAGWSSSNEQYECYINSCDYYYSSENEINALSALEYYLLEDEDGGQVYQLFLTVESALFDANDYQLNLAWNYSDSVIKNIKN